MNNSIEALDRKRNRLLSWILAVYGVWHGILLFFALMAHFKFPASLKYFISGIRLYFLIAGAVALTVFLLFIVRWLIYKRTLKKDPETAHAVNDERVRQNWLMAFRTAFFVMIGLAIVLEISKIVSNSIPQVLSPSGLKNPGFRFKLANVLNFLNFYHLQIVIYAGIMTCLGSFLRRNRMA